MLLSRSHLEQIVSQMIGVPYKEGGRSCQEGFDCLGVILYVYQQLNLDISMLDPHIVHGLYCPKTDQFAVTKNCVESLNGQLIQVLSPVNEGVMPLDILGLINHKQAHSALVLDGSRMLHSTSSDNHKVVIRDIFSYKHKSLFSLRYKGITWTH